MSTPDPKLRTRIAIWLPVSTVDHLAAFATAFADLESTFVDDYGGCSSCRITPAGPVWHGIWHNKDDLPIRDSHVIITVDRQHLADKDTLYALIRALEQQIYDVYQLFPKAAQVQIYIEAGAVGVIGDGDHVR